MLRTWSGCIVTAALVASGARAQNAEKIEPEKAREYGKALVAELKKQNDLPFALDADTEKAIGIHADKRGALVVPDKRASAAAIQKADKTVVPLGTLFLYRITPISAETPIAPGSHRSVEVTMEDGNKATIHVLHLGAMQVAGRPVLVAYTSGKTPTIVAELVESSDGRGEPIDVDGAQVGGNRAALTLAIAGRYRASLHMTSQD